MSTSVTIEPLAARHKADWLRLYAGYAAYYHAPLTAEGAEVVWGWLTDPGHVFEGLVARVGDRLVGLVHFRAMPSPLRASEIGFIDDLFVDPERRGSGAAEALIEGVYAVAGTRGWPLVRWITQDDNYRARAVYDRLAVKTRWNLYEKKFDPNAY
ncbi:MAG: GNAT family N-acetyltransferase [Alphaproteobacteria bacterium]